MEIYRTRAKVTLKLTEKEMEYAGFLQDIAKEIYWRLDFYKVYDGKSLLAEFDWSTTPQAQVMADCISGRYGITRYYPAV